MKKKNWFALLLTAALSLSLLTGCGGSSKQSEAASGDNSADAPAASESRLDKVLAAGKITNVCEPYFAPYEFIDNTKSGQEQFRGRRYGAGPVHRQGTGRGAGDRAAGVERRADGRWRGQVRYGCGRHGLYPGAGGDHGYVQGL